MKIDDDLLKDIHVLKNKKGRGAANRSLTYISLANATQVSVVATVLLS